MSTMLPTHQCAPHQCIRMSVIHIEADGTRAGYILIFNLLSYTGTAGGFP
jgi:hypothetical protein